MPRENDPTATKKPSEPTQPKRGFKLRSTNDLQLLSMILDEDPMLREKVLRFLEGQLGKRALLKVDPESR